MHGSGSAAFYKNSSMGRGLPSTPAHFENRNLIGSNSIHSHRRLTTIHWRGNEGLQWVEPCRLPAERRTAGVGAQTRRSGRLGRTAESGGEPTFTKGMANGEVAPIPAVRGTVMDPRGSTSCGPSTTLATSKPS